MKTIILDRDGVINEDSDAFIKTPDEWIPIPGSLEAIARLNQAGYRVLVASNQSGLARGLFNLETLTAIHAKMESLLQEQGGRLDGIYCCPHGPDDHCDCRKPKPGLLQQIKDELGLTPENTILVGDSLRDLQAAQAANIRPVLVLSGKGSRTATELGTDSDIEIHNDLAAFVTKLLA
jgi:D-glycero-D-manno-heptose 1,7-bisphosphate phosphatase